MRISTLWLEPLRKTSSGDYMSDVWCYQESLLRLLSVGSFNSFHRVWFGVPLPMLSLDLIPLAIQFSSVAQSCPTLRPHGLQHARPPCSSPAPGVYSHSLCLLTFYWVGDAIQPSHPLLSPSSPTFNLSQHQGLFKWVSSSHQVAKGLEFQLQHQSLQWTLRTDLL